MKRNIIILFLLLISSVSIGQNLPKFELKENKTVNIPENLETNEIAIVIEQFGGWSAYTNLTYYIFKNNGAVITYSKQAPKSYLKKKKDLKETITKIDLSSEQVNQLNKNLNSKITSNFLNYSQKNFSIDLKNSKSTCIISDDVGYAMTFIQNEKETSYKYYAPEFNLNKCKDKNINKVVLGKYVELIKIWKLK